MTSTYSPSYVPIPQADASAHNCEKYSRLVHYYLAVLESFGRLLNEDTIDHSTILLTCSRLPESDFIRKD